MARKRYTAEQIIGTLRQAEVVSICRLREPPNNPPNFGHQPLFVSYDLITGVSRRDQTNLWFRRSRVQISPP